MAAASALDTRVTKGAVMAEDQCLNSVGTQAATGANRERLPPQNPASISRVSRSVAQPGRAPRSGRGGRRFKSCRSDQHLPDHLVSSATGYATDSLSLRCRVNARLALAKWSG